MAQLLDPQTRQLVDVPDLQAVDLINEGSVLVPEEYFGDDGRLRLVRDGVEILVDDNQVLDFLTNGFKFPASTALSYEGIAEQEKAAKYEGDIAMPLLAGFVKDVTFGQSAAIARQLGGPGEAMLEALQTAEQYNPGLVKAGEIGSMIGTYPLAGGPFKSLFKAAPGAALPRLAASKVGKLAGAAGEKVFGKKLFEQVGRWSAEGAVEAGTYATKDALYQAGLQDKEVFSQEFMSQLGDKVVAEAKTGAIIGSAFPVVGGVAKLAGRIVAPVIKEVVGAATPAVFAEGVSLFKEPKAFFRGIMEETSLDKVLNRVGQATKLMTRAERSGDEASFVKGFKKWLASRKERGEGLLEGEWSDVIPRVDRIVKEVGEEIDGFYSRLDESLAKGDVEGIVADDIVKELEAARLRLSNTATAAESGFWATAISAAKRDAILEELASISRLPLDKQSAALNRFAKDSGIDALRSPAAIKKAAAQQAPAPSSIDDTQVIDDTVGEFIDTWEGPDLSLLDDTLVMDGAVGGFLEDVNFDTIRAITQDLDPKTLDAAYKKLYRQAKGNRTTQLGYKASQTSRNRYRSDAKLGKQTSSPGADWNKGAAAIYGKKLSDAAEEGMKKSDDFARFKELNEEYGYSKILEDITGPERTREMLGDKLTGREILGGVASGLAATAFMGMPSVFAPVVGAVGVLGNRYLGGKSYDMTMSVAERLGTFFAKREMRASNAMTSRIGKLLEASPRAVKTAAIVLTSKDIDMLTPPIGEKRKKSGTKKEALAHLADTIQYMNDNPDILASSLEQDLEQLQKVSDEIAGFIAATEVRKMQFLADRAPKRQNIINKIQPELYTEPSWANGEMYRYENLLKMSIAPMDQLFYHLERGTLTTELVEGLDYIYPSLTDSAREKFIEETAKLTKPTSAAKMGQFAKFINRGPLAQYQTAGFLARQKMQYAKDEGQGGAPGLRKSSAAKGQTQVLTTTNTESAKHNLSLG
tara:strand:- start:5211 stop:8153 length:2943 start_codon:yes stop_codon:yes gene_type:complete